MLAAVGLMAMLEILPLVPPLALGVEPPPSPPPPQANPKNIKVMSENPINPILVFFLNAFMGSSRTPNLLILKEKDHLKGFRISPVGFISVPSGNSFSYGTPKG
jgi:hypothetical protein